MRSALLTTAFIFSAFAFNATAMPRDGWMSNIPAGATVLNLSESAHKTVEQDRLRATLRIEHEGDNAKTVQDAINKAMADALAAGKSYDEVKLTTRGYHVYKRERYVPKRLLKAIQGEEEKVRETYWTGSQTLQLDSANSEKLLELAGRLQNMGFATSGINYYLSRAAAESHREELIKTALETIKQRAQSVGTQLDLPKVKFARISFGDAQPPHPMQRGMMQMAMEAADNVSKPSATPGDQNVQVTVNVTAYLQE